MVWVFSSFASHHLQPVEQRGNGFLPWNVLVQTYAHAMIKQYRKSWLFYYSFEWKVDWCEQWCVFSVRSRPWDVKECWCSCLNRTPRAILSVLVQQASWSITCCTFARVANIEVGVAITTVVKYDVFLFDIEWRAEMAKGKEMKNNNRNPELFTLVGSENLENPA